MINSITTLILTMLFLCFNGQAQTNDDAPFVVVKEKQKNQIVLKSYLATGEIFMIDTIVDSVKVEVILPFIYVFDQKNNKLNIFDRHGLVIIKNISSTNYSANKYGLLILNQKKQLRIFSIQDDTAVECPVPLDNIYKFKISDHVILTYSENLKITETYQLNNARNNYYPLSRQGWSQQTNISSAAFNDNFMILQDWQQSVQISNVQGNSINTSRGIIKSYYMTTNYLIAHYGNGKVEVFNPFEKQYILSLPQVYAIKASNTFTSFRWDKTELTIINEKGEIFTLDIKDQSKFSQGEDNYALSNGDEVKIYNSSGLELQTARTEQLINHYFLGDFLCLSKKNSATQYCFNSKIRNEADFNFRPDSDSLTVGLSNWGFYQYNSELSSVQLFFNNGTHQTLTSIMQIYAPLTPQKNEHSFLTF